MSFGDIDPSMRYQVIEGIAQRAHRPAFQHRAIASVDRSWMSAFSRNPSTRSLETSGNGGYLSNGPGLSKPSFDPGDLPSRRMVVKSPERTEDERVQRPGIVPGPCVQRVRVKWGQDVQGIGIPIFRP